MATTGPIKILESIQGSSFLAGRAAMGVFQPFTPDIAQGKIEVVREAGAEFVVFTDRHRQLGVRTGTTSVLNASDLRDVASNRERFKLVDSIEGTHFLAIRTAEEIFRAHKPDLNRYRIEVLRDGDLIIVVFSDKDRPAGTKGSVGLPGFEVALDARDRRVRRSNFVR